MATLNILEFSGTSIGSAQGAPIVQLPPLAEQNVTISAVDALATALHTATRIVRLQSDTDCFVKVGAASTTASMPLAAGFPEYFGVAGGAIIHAITA